MINLINLSKICSHALRHKPELYDLRIDQDGWCNFTMLLSSIKKNILFKNLTKSDIEKMISISEKIRFEIKGDKIRALYGHSLNEPIRRVDIEPPNTLYHGTSFKNYLKIKKEGLKPMSRQFVHLTTNKKTALKTGKRKSDKTVLLEVMSINAFREDYKFYFINNDVWLTNKLPSKFLKKIN